MSGWMGLTDEFDSLNLGVVLGVMQIAKRVPFDNPDVLNGVRAMYVASNLIILFIYYLIHSKINKKKGTLEPPFPQPHGPICECPLGGPGRHRRLTRERQT